MIHIEPMEQKVLIAKKIEKQTSCCRNRFTILLSVIIIALLCQRAAWAGELVHGQYRSFSGKSIELHLSIGTPPPTHIIVALVIPPGIKVTRSEPEAQKIDTKTGKIKWLLKKVQPGSKTVRVKLAEQVQPSAISSIIRYRNPVSGKYIEVHISP